MPWIVQDPFTRADAATLGTGWTNKQNAPGIFSNSVDVTVTASENVAYYSGYSWPANHWAQARTVVAGAAGRAMGIGVRCAANANQDGYYAGSDAGNAGDSNRRIFKWVGGVWTDLGTQAVAVAAGDLLRLEIIGSRLNFYVNGTLSVTANDTSYTAAGGGAGMLLVNGAVDVALLDEFEAGDFNHNLGGIQVASPPNPPAIGMPITGY